VDFRSEDALMRLARRVVNGLLLSLLLAGPVTSARAAGSAGSAGSGEVLLDRIVAVVDGHPILYSDVMQKVARGPLIVVSAYPAEDNAPAYDRALQDAINFELVLSKAKDLEIDVRDEEVDQEIKSFLQSRGLSQDGLMDHLQQAGLKFADYKRDFRDQMILRRFQGRVITPLVKVTDKDVETYYLKKSGATSDLVELVLRQILIAASSSATPDVIAAKKKLAAEVHQKLVDGMAFPEAVKVYSDEDDARENGGLMAPVKLKDLATQIRAVIEPLEVGKFTDPVRTPLGFHIFYLEAKKFSGSDEFKSQKKQLEFELRNIELANQTKRWLTEQRQKSDVKIIKE